MTGSEALDRLAQLAGIEDGWWDFFGVWRPVSAETKRAFLAAMGFKVGNDADTVASLVELDTRPWRRWLEPVTVFEERGGSTEILVTIPARRDKDVIEWVLEEELGPRHSGAFQVDTLHWLEERWIDGVFYKRWRFYLPELPPLGYHRLTLRARDGVQATTTVIVAPASGHIPESMAGDGKVWGVATQLYALRHGGDWGVGTYKSLEILAAGAAALGAATVGVNPLHALFPNQPERFSPYSPSSRRFLDIAYIDVEALPEFEEGKMRRSVASPGCQASLARLKQESLVDYPGVAQMVRPVLENLYTVFRKNHLEPEDERGKLFRAFQKQGGRAAQLFCTFEALQEKLLAENKGYWRQWPGEYRHPKSPAVERFFTQNRVRVEFYWWLQFVADQQLGAAHQAGRGVDGRAMGLYRDLGVGIAGDGAEAWLEQDNLALGVSVGAPPDPLALKGQDWGLIPFNPIALKEAAYAPFIGVMAANMRHAGALRLDHAMALQRLYWVPPGVAADQGAYVRYPVGDLFRLVALESRRNHCLVIGEDLGTVPEGFRERMDHTGLFAYRVMVFEKDENQQVRAPDAFDIKALAIFATHDLPSVRGWWKGADIDKRIALDLYPQPEMAEGEREARQLDREKMVAAFAGQGLLPAKFPVNGRLTNAQAEALTLAAHRYLAACRSKLMMVQIEDVLALESQMNVPGTTDQHPNWRTRFPVDVDTFLADKRLKELAALLAKCRGGAGE